MENKYVSIVKKLKLTDYKKIAVSILALLILLVVCNLMLKGVGTSHSERNIFLFVIFIVILDSSKKSFYYIALPICILHALYAPIGFMFGPPSYSYVASVFATNIAETREFFNAIPIKNYIKSLVIIIGFLLYRHLTSKFNIQFYRNKTLLIVFIIFAMLKQAPLTYINNLSASYEEVKNELETLNELTVADQWGRTTLKNSKYDTYVLIIGESARKDYHHAFGYPINDTPFMSNAKGILVDGLKSGGTGTIASLRLMLTKSDNKTWQPNYGLNFVDLAKDAGIETYWLSNQGYIGIYDTPVSAIAKKSDHTYFTKYGDWDTKNTSDFLLLDHIRNIVNQNEKKKKLIVVHLLGSHPDACDRIFDYKKIMKNTNKEFSYLNCYISSIKKTDEFIKKTYDILNTKYKKEHSTFSLIYFSDHGMVHQKVNDIIYMNNSTISQFHYDIPLFNISSDSKERKFCKSFKSGLNFTNGIGNWLGIVNSNLDEEYDLFDCMSDKNDYGLFKKIDDILSPPDYAVNIS